MPVTAKLSRKFYERFGDDIADEFVDWFNAVDSTYQNQLRELNELNWQRFRSELHAAIATSEARLTEKFGEKLSSQSSELMKWMFIYLTGQYCPLAG